MELAVRALVDAPHSGTGVADPEGDEHPHEFAIGRPRKLEHERERTLGCRVLPWREVQLRAAGQPGPIRSLRVACQNLGERWAAPFGVRSTARRKSRAPRPENPRTASRQTASLAVATDADAIVTGDRDLLDLVEPPVAVLTPRALIERLDAPA